MEIVTVNEILDLDNICRVCLKCCDDLFSIFQTKNANKKIMSCAMIEVEESDGLPPQICPTCLSNLHVAYDFRKLCEQSDAILKEYIRIREIEKHSIIDAFTEEDNYDPNAFTESTENGIHEVDMKDDVDWELENNPKVKKKNTKSKKDTPTRKQKIIDEPHEATDLECEKSRRVMCEVCGKLMQTRTALELHMRTHTDERPYRCHKCTKAFRQKPSLINHIRIHFDERPFSCTICNKGCRTKQDLKVHMRCHTQEQPYKCKMCDRKFSTSSNLAKHVNVIHLNERKYKCTMCEAAFNIRFSLNKHLKWHESADESYLCPVCNKTIKKCNISLHIKRMHPDQANVLPFTCRICNMQFGNELGLQAHLRQLHCINTAIGQTVDNPTGTIDKSNIPKI